MTIKGSPTSADSYTMTNQTLPRIIRNIGDLVTFNNGAVAARIVKVHPLGTVDVRTLDRHGNAVGPVRRITGLPIFDVR